MSSMEEFKKIRERLKSKIKVAVEWDGRVPDNLENAYDVAEEHGYAYPLDMLERAAQESIRRADVEDKNQYAELEEGVRKLSGKVNDLAQKIFKRAEQLGESATSIPEDYFDRVARKFAQENKKDCVVVAPDLWFPDFIKL